MPPGKASRTLGALSNTLGAPPTLPEVGHPEALDSGTYETSPHAEGATF